MSPSFDINLKRILNVLMRPIFFKQVVGSQARILYSDQNGRKEIATAFNEAVGSKKLKVCTWKIGKKLVDCTQVLFKVYVYALCLCDYHILRVCPVSLHPCIRIYLFFTGTSGDKSGPS